MFANGPGDLGSVSCRVIPKTQKMVLDASLLNTQHYKVRIKGKVEQSREGVAPSPTHWCSSYRKGSLRVTLDYGRQLYFTLLYSIHLVKYLNNYWKWKIWHELTNKNTKWLLLLTSFFTSARWWPLTGAWVISSRKSLGLFSVFGSILTMQ